METLNTASLDVWNEHLKNTERKKISDRILVLDSLHELTEKEEIEYKKLLSLERKLIADSFILTDINKRAIKKYNYYEGKLNNNARLSAIFFERINSTLNGSHTHTEDDITKIYIQMMEEDMDIAGHQKINERYNEILSDEDSSLNKKTCSNLNCIYCKEINDAEYSKAYSELEKNGYFNSIIKEEDKLMELMVMINRLENELLNYKTPDCEINYPQATDE